MISSNVAVRTMELAENEPKKDGNVFYICSSASTERGLPQEPFNLSDWQNQLDLLVDPTVSELQQHLAICPPSERNGRAATWLRAYIQELQANAAA